jgi:hypothetical protein
MVQTTGTVIPMIQFLSHSDASLDDLLTILGKLLNPSGGKIEYLKLCNWSVKLTV